MDKGILIVRVADNTEFAVLKNRRFLQTTRMKAVSQILRGKILITICWRRPFQGPLCALEVEELDESFALATKLISLPSHSSFVVAGITLAVLATSIMLMLVALTLRGQPYMLWADLVFGFVASGLLLLGLYQIRRSTA
ncbi:hypothetical protein AUI07_03415 [archaeon 13_2_20CM_2_53_6]|nr:MAG: hypothetical protein AUI07_03415 [archaeon 13_2_20CM_2_53_6]